MKSKKISHISRRGWHGLQWNVYDNEWAIKSFYEQKDFQTLLNGISKIQDKLPTLKKGSTILIDKGSEVPRPKLKEFIADNGYKKVTLMSKANVIAIRRESVKQLQNTPLKTLLMLSDNDNKTIGSSKIDLCYLQLSNDESIMDQEYFDVKNRCTSVNGYILEGYRNAKQFESIQFIVEAIKSKATLVYDDCLMSEINSDGLDLDDDIYETIEGMLLSKDLDTFNLGIEMLSNMNLERNLFKISVLMNNCFNKTHRLNSLSQIKNTNFKALLAYLQSNGIRWNQKWDSFGMSMLVRFSGTEWEPNIKEYMVNCLNDMFSKLGVENSKKIVNIVYK